ncbi:GntR family transcriptional regulator [Streptomyces sp. NBC_00249]|uniref:GntR family transcriptional regulator n=1 Tax=Streptomyces sp. NBC_00249 TaxID=2975690 RepID=UPI00225BE8D7|nr:GntR family transcriptional regulator [Streptomyces sp. NBC_00249]MCX5198012.1 GntR family transcriptional regulator [Streptomyces sp. NBC_00249]
MSLDPDDPRPPYAQIINALRAAILTKTLAPGEKLPSQNDLTKRYKVSRATVQRALRDLQDEGLIVARQGSGVFVRSRTERPMGLRPHIEQAFAAEEVTIDFAGFSGETLHSAIREPIDKIRSGRLRPQSINVRILVPDTRKPQVIPAPIDAPDTEAAEGAETPLKRAHKIMLRNAGAIVDAVNELETLGLVEQARVSVRVHNITPSFKLYVLNRREAFFGFYPIAPNTVPVNGKPTKILDILGLDSVLFSYADGDDRGHGSQWLEQGQLWFDSMWDNLGEDFQP